MAWISKNFEDGAKKGRGDSARNSNTHCCRKTWADVFSAFKDQRNLTFAIVCIIQSKLWIYFDLDYARFTVKNYK